MTIKLPWHIAGLLAIGVIAVVLAIAEVGPQSSSASARTETETVTAQRGVVQETVTGDGNVAAAVDDDVDFQTSGTLKHVYVHEGEHVKKGQLVATLDPASENLTVTEDKLSLKSAEETLKEAKKETVSSSDDTSDDVDAGVEDDFADFSNVADTTSTDTTTAAPTQTTTTVAETATTPATTTSDTTTSSTIPETTTSTTVPETTTTTAASAPTETTTTTSATGAGDSSDSDGESSSSGSTTTSSTDSASSGDDTTTTAASKASTVATDKAAVEQARSTLKTDEEAVQETKLDAPASGTIVSLEDLSPGDAVSSGTDSSASSTSSDDTTSSSSDDTSSSSSSDDTSSSFAEIVNARKLTMSVSFDESDISEIKVGEPATVTIEALTGVELGAHVTSISTVGTEDSDVVTYTATLTLDQRNAQVKPGMTADASVIYKQASGVTLPTAAVTSTSSTATVDVLKDGKPVPTTVVVGVKGTDRVQIVSGLKAGQKVRVKETLPAAGTATTTTSSSSSGTLDGTAATGAGATGGGAPGGGGFGGP